MKLPPNKNHLRFERASSILHIHHAPWYGSFYRWRSDPQEYTGLGNGSLGSRPKGEDRRRKVRGRSRADLDVRANTRRLSRANPKPPAECQRDASLFPTNAPRDGSRGVWDSRSPMGPPSDWRCHVARHSIRGVPDPVQGIGPANPGRFRSGSLCPGVFPNRFCISSETKSDRSDVGV